MATLKDRILTDMIYGAIAILPLAVLAYIAFQIFDYVRKVLEVLRPYLGSSPYFGAGIIILVSIITLLGICYLFGALIRTQIGALTFDKIHKKLIEFIPGYEIITNLLRGIATKEMSYPPALITLFAPGTAVLGFVMEDEGDDYLTVFVPSAPVLTAGAIHVVERSRVQTIDGSSMKAAECISKWGRGLKRLRGAKVPPHLLG
jgi:uncharacterized membrane protein